MKFNVVIAKEMVKKVEIEADSAKDALQLVSDMYYGNKIDSDYEPLNKITFRVMGDDYKKYVIPDEAIAQLDNEPPLYHMVD